MASNKALLLLALLAFATVLGTAAGRQARDDKKTEKMVNDVATGVEDWHGSGGGSDHEYSHGCEYGCCHRVYHGGCQRCCSPGGTSTPEVNN